jgi:predicted RNA methylase
LGTSATLAVSAKQRALAKRYDIKMIGIEKDPHSVAIAQARVQASELSDRIQIVQGHIFQLESLSQQLDYVLAEAILTMQSLSGKAKVLQGVRDRTMNGAKMCIKVTPI